MKHLGKQLTLMRELKNLENKGKTKLDNIDKRDNERAIQLLTKKINDEKHKHEYLHSHSKNPSLERMPLRVSFRWSNIYR